MSTENPNNRRRGMTIVEMVIAIAIGAILTIIVVSFTMYSGRTLAGLSNYVDLNAKSRVALDRMTREIRQAADLKSYGTNSLTIIDSDGVDVVYSYSPTDRALLRSKGDVAETLLADCDEVQFALFLQNPQTATFDLKGTYNPAASKVISVSWTCSRTLLGAIVNKETVQAARIVIRKG